MTLDEAIAHAREVAKEQKSKYDKCPTRTRYNCAMCFHNPKCDEDAKEHEQLAEWLEELKAYRQYIDLTEIPEQYKLGFQDGIIAGNNKAIDDFVRFASDMPTVETEDGEIRPMWLEEIAEQLKESEA